MKRYLGVKARILACAVLLGLVFALSAVTVAGATAHTLPRQHVAIQISESHSSPSVCTLTASPASQTVGVNQTARVKVSIDCPGGYLYVLITWGDGTTSRYNGGCTSPCTLLAEHSYAIPGDYHPKICLEPVNVCTTVEIRVI